MKKIFISLLIILNISIISFAHSGRTDANGGHYDRSTGEYHYHNNGYSSDDEDNIIMYPTEILEEENLELRQQNEKLEEQIVELNNKIEELTNQYKQDLEKANTTKANTISLSFFIIIIGFPIFYSLGERSKKQH